MERRVRPWQLGLAQKLKTLQAPKRTRLVICCLILCWAYPCCFSLPFLFINPKTKAGDVEIKAYFVVTVTWKDYSPDDIDVWVENPLGKKLWFRQREVGLLHLDRDDRGMEDDKIKVDNELVENPLNQEIVTIRGVYPGRYTVNVHYFKSLSDKPVEVSVRIF